MTTSRTEAYINEINYQKKMLRNLANFQKILMLISACTIALIVAAGSLTWLKITGIVLLVLSVVINILVGWAVYNGRINVNRVIDAFAEERKMQKA